MTKDQLLITIENYNRGLISFDAVETAVDIYSSALIAAKPLVSGRSEQFFCWDEEALGTESRCKAECEICKNKGEQKNCHQRLVAWRSTALHNAQIITNARGGILPNHLLSAALFSE